jgi:hypothetical protein
MIDLPYALGQRADAPRRPLCAPRHYDGWKSLRSLTEVRYRANGRLYRTAYIDQLDAAVLDRMIGNTEA